MAVLGLIVRGWAAGTIDKGRDLATGGPYAHTQNPMYLGSFIIGLGLTVAGSQWIWPVAFVAFFAAVYVPTMFREGAELAERFGARFGAYAASVPRFVPRLTRYHDSHATVNGFAWRRYLRYREWEALVGVTAAIAVMALKMRYLT